MQVINEWLETGVQCFEEQIRGHDTVLQRQRGLQYARYASSTFSVPAHSLDTADLELTLISTRIAKECGVDGLCLCRISDACDLKFSKFIVQ